MTYKPDDHFRGVTKMIELGKSAKREIDNFILTRYAASGYLAEADACWRLAAGGWRLAAGGLRYSLRDPMTARQS